VTDAADFRVVAHPAVPDWVADAVVYQVFPDRFARSAAADGRPVPPWARPARWDEPVVHRGPDTGRQLYGGDLPGIAEHLDHLVDLGVTVLYLTPFFPARSNHRYDASSFDTVDPVLGGDEALAALLEAAHGRGLRVVGDLTTNHTGDAHEWFLAAVADPSAPEAGYYFFDEHPGRYASWLGVSSLPKLDQSCTHLRERLYDGPGSVVARWLSFGLDGWRIDVANMTGRYGAQDLAHDVARRLAATARAARPDAWVLAEHGHDAGPDLPGDGWHGTMDYAGFTGPVCTWLTHSPDLVFGFGRPVATPSLPAHAVVATMREVHGAMPWRAQGASSLHLDSHDVPRFRTVVGGGSSGGVSAAGRERHLVGLAMQLTMPGVPTLFAGDELGLTGVDGEHARTPFPWDRPESWDAPTLEAFRSWIALRRTHVALRRGGLRWVHAGEDSMTFLREHPDERVLVHLARADQDPLVRVLARTTSRFACRWLRWGWAPSSSWSPWRATPSSATGTPSCCPRPAPLRTPTGWADRRRGRGPLHPVLVSKDRLTGLPLLCAVAAGVLSSVVPYAADLMALRLVPQRQLAAYSTSSGVAPVNRTSSS
jgi:alpha-glucosidase